MTLERILAVAEKYNYFSRLTSKSNSNVYNLKLGDLGLRFLNNIKNHWFSSNASVNTAVFDHTKNTYDQNLFYDSFKIASNSHEKLPPFDMIEFYKTDLNKYSNSDTRFKFSFPSYTILSSTKFLTRYGCLHHFYNLQRERRLWWKKITAYPERLSIRETKINSENGIEKTTADIILQLPWGKHIVETVTLTTNDMKFKLDNVTPVRINTEISAENATILLYCEGAELRSDDHMVITLDNKLSPCKCIFAIDPKYHGHKDLLGFSYLLNEKLKDNKIPSILPYNLISLEDQFQRNDECGLPFSIQIDEDSVHTGVVGLRCRDTTLIEEVHASELPSHITTILNADNPFDIPLKGDFFE